MMYGADGGIPEQLSLESFTEIYAKAPARFGNQDIPLGAALAMEEAFCPAGPDKRGDAAQRLRYLAASLAVTGSLHPEHQYLLPKPDNAG